MGWDCGAMRPGNTTPQQECDYQLTWEAGPDGARVAQRVVVSAVVDQVHYAAIARTDRPGEVRGMVTLFEGNRRDFRTKQMGEEMGPYYYNAPADVLGALSPLDGGLHYAAARDWRAKCYHRLYAAMAPQVAAWGADDAPVMGSR